MTCTDSWGVFLRLYRDICLPINYSTSESRQQKVAVKSYYYMLALCLIMRKKNLLFQDVIVISNCACSAIWRRIVGIFCRLMYAEEKSLSVEKRFRVVNRRIDRLRILFGNLIMIGRRKWSENILNPLKISK